MSEAMDFTYGAGENESDADQDQQTVVVHDEMRFYLNSIRGAALLNAEQEVMLAKRMEAGLFAGKILLARQDPEQADPEILESAKLLEDDGNLDDDLRQVQAEGEAAKQQMIEANLPFVVHKARAYKNRGMPMVDVIQEGNIGLIRAVEKFDYTKGYKFSTYAGWWVRQAILVGLANRSRLVRLPKDTFEMVGSIGRTKRELHKTLGREAEPQEIADELGIDVGKVKDLSHYDSEVSSLDRQYGEEGNRTSLGEYLSSRASTSPVDKEIAPTEKEVMQRMKADAFRALVERALGTLNKQETEIIRRRFGIGTQDGQPVAYKQLNEEYGHTERWAPGVEKTILAKIRNSSVSGFIKSQLEDLLVED